MVNRLQLRGPVEVVREVFDRVETDASTFSGAWHRAAHLWEPRDQPRRVTDAGLGSVPGEGADHPEPTTARLFAGILWWCCSAVLLLLGCRPDTAELDGRIVPVFRQIDQDWDDNASCAPPPYKIEGELYEWMCQAVRHERIGEVAGLAEGGDFDIVRRKMGSGLLAGRQTGELERVPTWRASG